MSHSKTFSSTCLEMFPAEAAGVTAELHPLYQLQTLVSALCPICMKLQQAEVCVSYFILTGA